MRIRNLAALCVFSCAIAVPLGAQADTDGERAALARIAHEIDQLQALVMASASQADTTARVKFRYDLLAKDLELVKRGVEDHQDSPRQPRAVEPLKGDYRR